MATRKAILTPFTRSPAIELAKGSRIFRKQVLRPGVFDYKGQRLEFTDAYLDNLVKAFDDQAFDAVSLMFADADNRHTKAIDDVRGQVLGFERSATGLDAIVRAANDQAAQTLRENPQIGVSLGIEPDYERSDGRRWDAAVHHVLATTDPVITGLSPWESVELGRGDDGIEVLDLSRLEFGRDEGIHQRSTSGTDDTEVTEMSAPTGADQMSPEDVALFRQFQAFQAMQGGGAAPPSYGEYQPPTDDEIADIAAGLLEDDEDQVDDDREPVGAGSGTVQLAREDRDALDLANQRYDDQSIELAAIRGERDEARWTGMVTELTGPDYGVAPAVLKVDGVKGLLLSRRPIQLSNGADVNPAVVLENVIKTMARSRPLDLSRGDVFDEPDEDEIARHKAATDEAIDYGRSFGLIGH